jgi:hypothetical protein
MKIFTECFDEYELDKTNTLQISSLLKDNMSLVIEWADKWLSNGIDGTGSYCVYSSGFNISASVHST